MQSLPMLLAQDDAAGGVVAVLILLIYLGVIVLSVASMWVIFAKAGHPGWASLIPIYNFVVLLEIVGKPIWWIILLFVPCLNIGVMILLSMELATCFGKGPGFGLGLAFLGPIFYPILAFGDAKYRGPSA